MFAIKCVLSCPVALKKWKELAHKLNVQDVPEPVGGYPHDTCQKVLEMWYEQKTDKVLALQHLKGVLHGIGAKNAHGMYGWEIIIIGQIELNYNILL